MSYCNELCEDEKYIINGQQFSVKEIEEVKLLQQSKCHILGNVEIYDIALVLRALGKL